MTAVNREVILLVTYASLASFARGAGGESAANRSARKTLKTTGLVYVYIRCWNCIKIGISGIKRTVRSRKLERDASSGRSDCTAFPDNLYINKLVLYFTSNWFCSKSK